jgi:hypothetical protein
VPTTVGKIGATVSNRFAQVPRTLDLEKNFPEGPCSACMLGYNMQKIDALQMVNILPHDDVTPEEVAQGTIVR